MKGKALRLTVLGYTMCILAYNFLGTASPAWTNFYYTFEKGFTVLALCYQYNKDEFIDKLFIDYARFLNIGMWSFFLVCSINEKAVVYNLTVLVSVIIASTFGSLIVLYRYIRRLKR